MSTQGTVKKILVDDLEMKREVDVREEHSVSLFCLEHEKKPYSSNIDIVIEGMDFSQLTIGALIQIGVVVLEVVMLATEKSSSLVTKVLNSGLVKEGNPVEIIFM